MIKSIIKADEVICTVSIFQDVSSVWLCDKIPNVELFCFCCFSRPKELAHIIVL